ncbi:DUF4959 domain-containing protein [Mucilaginibacter psychrotolerans]|uniref:DUF4959 domain-containing protein n=1 Tax=Mucilaginibacter psychrotolerans TaxID=1524096 RepID=A0A4Y8SAQ2_9SPHI|nr:DUF4959 domain-containing protein [Mucilaginibacter psychrotolerans]TFF35476.1 DUF4959 domain-containing protein [Mucilaginibacter psychrotolerans]
MKFNNIKAVRFYCYWALACMILMTACQKSDIYREPDSADKSKPETVTDVKVKNFNGGAVLSYKLPSSQDLLYVMAEYKINGKSGRQTKASYFLDTLIVDGFERSQEYTVTLRTVSRANVQSDPVTITVHPDTPYYQLIKKTLKVAADFGGINIKGYAPGKSTVSVNVVALDNDLNKYTIRDQHFGIQDTINYSVRGFDPSPTKFGVYVTDQFGNVSDTTLLTITPLFETMLDKTKFSVYPSASDAYIGYGGILPYLWDGRTDEVGGAQPWQTTIGPVPKLMQCTFSVGRTYKLSHFMMYLRGYGYDNPQSFTVYGSNADNPQDAVTPGGTPAGTVTGDWVNLGNYNVPNPPSGLPIGNTNSADQAYLNNGVDFNVPFESPAVKHIRIVVTRTWFGQNYTNIREVTLYGAPQ